MPAMRPWSSACLPSVAETCEDEISSSLIGSAPVFRRFASSCADLIVKPPEISEPLRPSMPSGFCWKSMYGTEMSSLSRTIAKCWNADCGSPPKNWLCPRWAISRVVSCHALPPLSVKSNVTFGAPVPPAPLSKFCSGFLMSVPLSAGSSRRT